MQSMAFDKVSKRSAVEEFVLPRITDESSYDWGKVTGKNASGWWLPDGLEASRLLGKLRPLRTDRSAQLTGHGLEAVPEQYNHA